jgi:large subunit ribosomal protein L22
MSASKARVVLNNIRGEDVQTARNILSGTTREAADVILKVLNSAIANAVNNDGLNADDLYVSAAFADEGITAKRFTPRARGRAGAIQKKSTHITVIVSKMDEDRLEILRNARSSQAAASRTRRVATSRKAVAEDVVAEDVVEEAPVEVLETQVETPVVETAAVEADVVTEVAPAEEVAAETVSEDTTEETN